MLIRYVQCQICLCIASAEDSSCSLAGMENILEQLQQEINSITI